MGDYERSWHKLPFRGQNIMPGVVRDQGEKPSCVFHAFCEAHEIEFRRQFALRDPPRTVDLLFDINSFIVDYETEVGCALGEDPPGRLATAARLFEEQGVYAHTSKWEQPRRVQMFHSEEHPNISFEDVEAHLSQGRPIMGGFTIGTDDNFEGLGRDDIYQFEPFQSTTATYNHMVVFVGSGMRGLRSYLVFLNSEGIGFGEDGFGRVWFDQVRAFRTVTLWVGETPSPSPPLATSSSSSTTRSSSTGGDESPQSEIVVSSLGSHQLRRETMKCLLGSVLVSGLQGLGAEIAKNLVLVGFKSVTLHDNGNVDLWDLSSNFFLTEKDVGKNRAQACVQKLQELTSADIISTLTGDLTKEHLSNFQAVVFTDISLERAVEFDDYCHSHQPPIAFIKSEVCGLFGSVFCDFGPEFTVLDVDGKEPHTGTVASISNDNPALVTCVNDEHLEFQDGDLVVFSGVHGMAELNDAIPRKIKTAWPYSFTLEEDTSLFGTYVRGGIVTQVKPTKVIKFKPLKEAMIEPGEFFMSDFSNFERPPLLHLAFRALDKFRNDLRRFPVAGSTDDVQMLIDFAISINETLGDRKLEEIDRKVLHHFASGSRAVLNPMAAMFGGIVCQEVVKARLGKSHPIYQFFYFHSVESLPVEPLEPGDLKPETENTRCLAQISVFGSKLQNKLEKAKFFMVGSGALGCEFLKNLALMGVSCSQNGKLIVRDDNVIEKNNLSHQFLFRDWNIGQPKSTAAAAAAMTINPNLRVVALQNRASPETENVFNDAFWDNLDILVNALDNVTARNIDSRCAYFKKPLLESGTLCATCNTRILLESGTLCATCNTRMAKFIAERIIPGTSTAMTAGLMCLLLYKALSEPKKTSQPLHFFPMTKPFNVNLPKF